MKPKHAGGRPQRKKEDFLPKDWKNIIMEKASLGWSQVEIKAHLCTLGGKFSDDLWEALKERDTEFSDTIKKAAVFCEAWWIAQSRKGLKSRYFQAFIWFCNMKNRFGWKDKTEIDHGVNDETLEKYKNKSVAELKAMLKEILPGS